MLCCHLYTAFHFLDQRTMFDNPLAQATGIAPPD